jgi:hypothetical protein
MTLWCQSPYRPIAGKNSIGENLTEWGQGHSNVAPETAPENMFYSILKTAWWSIRHWWRIDPWTV